METLSLIWEYIGQTNLFNFAIFVLIFAILFKNAKVGQKLEDAKLNIVNEIEESDNAKNESEISLKNIQENISHIEEEISVILKQSKNNANIVGEKILEDANRQVEVINENSQKNIENKVALTKNDILKRASLASIDVAKKHIINELNNNQGLHDKFIDESIETLGGIEL